MFEIEFLGTGNAAGVPVWGCECSACANAEQLPGRRRRSASLALHTRSGVTLLDAGLSDLAQRFRFEQIRGILLTHFHMDHVQGLFHLRWSESEPKLPVYRPDDPKGADDLYKHPGVLDFQPPLQPFVELDLGDFSIVPLPLYHSRVTLGYLICQGDFRMAYLTDTVELPEETRCYLQRQSLNGVVLDCSEPPRSTPPRNHNDLNSALACWRSIGAPRLWLTHISHRLDCWLQQPGNDLPEGVQLAADGLRLTCHQFR
ncbi:phosphonate metabolism protein PhnP [Aestuariirhabdus sp. Z084]|uniref:phosphonate metabolism protein PhnP n=1 Tax=Aestuariirhabdus haliotis TaxID=2918751 RepID=UPI00201B445E|nr:phosphonate metabolism protein PhnP [Aestuariirhabdus haliotis]MCL6415999.1 phosphonate metabolism protein PhnP [Aestuariirhabdus haliotis]MCL6419968.1 phosphonate metabolism protein PhnP [Aestuariirhabdus haliotis]